MNPAELYSTLLKLKAVEEKIKDRKGKLEIGDPIGIEYNYWIGRIPTLSPTELVEYNNYLMAETEKEVKSIKDDCKDDLRDAEKRIKKSIISRLEESIATIKDENSK